MNLQARIDRYKERGFQQIQAEILVLIEESAADLFTSFPDHFILFGGATLVLFYESPRLSRDLDLLASPSQIPKPEEIQAAVRSGIQPIAEICTVELRPVLPLAVFDDLAKNKFEAIRDSLRIVFSHRLGKVRQ